MTTNVLNPARDETVTSDKIVLRPLFGLMQGRNPADIEQFTIAEMEKHRLLRDDAVRLEARCREQPDDDERADLEKDYVTAMIAVHAQQTVVSTMLDILGFIPKSPVTKPH